MSLDPYASCPCGSGKKFKWCCQPIYAGIARAWEQEDNGQHETALRTILKVISPEMPPPTTQYDCVIANEPVRQGQ